MLILDFGEYQSGDRYELPFLFYASVGWCVCVWRGGFRCLFVVLFVCPLPHGQGRESDVGVVFVFVQSVLCKETASAAAFCCGLVGGLPQNKLFGFLKTQ